MCLFLLTCDSLQKRDAVNERFEEAMQKRKALGMAPPALLTDRKEEDTKAKVPEAEGTCV